MPPKPTSRPDDLAAAARRVNRATALKARQLLLANVIKGGTCDAIHLAGAIEQEADVFLTFDTDDFPVGQRVEGVWVDEPFFPGDGTNLFNM
ncbi:hypothetical protein [Actinophytocola oryzae]|uniref:PIN domain-containing protein n=1 Tax=Actinophytocola oryzae TaxID=502181 RepID=A0A4R7VB86_9PSEU|nr:hypothetical protein [Actinophytocola oryzae]TDV46286.1 hypothetical protein CLV71_111245 [Actinophytocola oryzae]